MINSVLTKTYSEPPYDIKEILRYSGCSKSNTEINSLIDKCIKELDGRLSYKVCYIESPLQLSDGKINFSFMNAASNALCKNLSGCSSAIIFAATVGIEIDRLITKYSAVSPAKALIFQAIGAERIESLCNLFNNEISQEFSKKQLYTAPRFSPGYGDLEISVQKDIFRVLDCPRKIGVSLNESMLMSPSKSVTAIIGISDTPFNKIIHPCRHCMKKDCNFRSENQ